MRIACWIPTATNTLTEYVKLTACPLQQRLHKSVSMLRYMYTASCFDVFLLMPHSIFFAN
jgi:hypothetical protein